MRLAIFAAVMVWSLQTQAFEAEIEWTASGRGYEIAQSESIVVDPPVSLEHGDARLHLHAVVENFHPDIWLETELVDPAGRHVMFSYRDCPGSSRRPEVACQPSIGTISTTPFWNEGIQLALRVTPRLTANPGDWSVTYRIVYEALPEPAPALLQLAAVAVLFALRRITPHPGDARNHDAALT